MAVARVGFLQRTDPWRLGLLELTPRDDIAEVLKNIKESGQIASGWYYPPMLNRGASGEATHAPAIWFRLPWTHTCKLKTVGADDETLNFSIACVSLLVGRRLTRGREGHFYRVAVDNHRLVDFGCTDIAAERIMGLAMRFYGKAPRTAVNLLLGAIHWFLFSQSYEHPFERFDGQYKVLDACCAVHRQMKPALWKGKTKPPHAGYVKFLHQNLGTPLPNWGVVRKTAAGAECDLSLLRNQLVHEARFDGEPIGYKPRPGAHPSIDRQLAKLNSRVILALLGESNSYIGSRVDWNQAMLIT